MSNLNVYCILICSSKLTLDCPFWYFLSARSELIYNLFPKNQPIKRVKKVAQTLSFRTVAVYSKTLSSQCKLNAQTERVHVKEKQVSLFSKTRQTIRLFEIQIVTLKTKFQIYACVLVLFSYMIFGILMTLNNIASFLSFLYVEPNTAIRKLGTATPYGCNDKIDGICILCSPTCRMWWIFSTPLLGVNEAIVIVIIHPYTCGSY